MLLSLLYWWYCTCIHAFFDLFSSWLVGWLCWGLTSQSTIFQSCRDGAIASWVINQYFRGVKCLAQGHNTAEVGLEPRTSRSGVRHSSTEPPRSPYFRVTHGICLYYLALYFYVIVLVQDPSLESALILVWHAQLC